MSIIVNESRKLFLLSTETTSYGFEVSSAGALLHLYWGTRLDRPEDLPYGEQQQFNPFQQPEKKPLVNQEYPASGGYFYEEPCLKVMFANGCRDAKLFYRRHTIERRDGMETLTVILEEEVYPMQVALFYRLYDGLDVLDRWAEITNTGAEPISLEDVQSAALYFPGAVDCRFSHLSGKWAGEYQLERHMMTQSKTVVESRHGISGPDSCPWFAVDERGEATEDRGRVWAGSLHWSGNWKIVGEIDRARQPRVTLGINDFDFGWKLRSGETFSAPRVTAVYSEEGFGGASRKFHRYLRNRWMPQDKVHQFNPISYNSWAVFEFDIDEQQQMQLAEKAAKIGIELFIMDDGWFGARDSDRAGLGDWTPSKTKFPRGLDPLIQRVNELGMSFGLWVEPEAVNEDSDLFRRHPEWTLRAENKPITMWRNQYVLNFAREDVCDYAWSYLEDLLTHHNIAYLKWDMNRYLCEPGWPERPIDEQREVWTRYVHNVHKLFYRIQERFPNVLLENCAGGGSRIDLAMSACSDLVNPSDNGDPLDNLKIAEGYSQVFLPRTEHRRIGDCPNFINGRTTPLMFRRNVSEMFSFGIGGNLLTASDADLAALRECIDDFKRTRHLTQHGEFHRLHSIYKGPYGAYEFVAEDGSEAVVFALGQAMQYFRPLARIRLRGLQPSTLYQINGKGVWSGRALMEIGIEPDLRGDFDSAKFHITMTTH